MNQKRINRVLEGMKERQLTQLFVADWKSIWYLTGYSCEPYERMYGLYLNASGRIVFVLNRLFMDPGDEFEKIWYSDTDDGPKLLSELIDPEKPLGIDKIWPARFLIPLMGYAPKATPVLASSIVDDCRARKENEEILLMKEASRVNDEVNHRARDYVHAGATEKEIADYIDKQYRLEGSESNAFTTIVSFGANATDPHHEPDDTVLREGDCVLIDMGCRKNRYCSDMTRTFFYKTVSDEQQKVYNIVKAANASAEKALRPGVKLSDIDGIARKIITDAGYGPYFTHRLGHFIGQDDHELGDVSSSSEIIAEEGMIFSIEPGIYLPGKFGVRIEDLVLITKDGYEVLNHEPKELTVLTEK